MNDMDNELIEVPWQELASETLQNLLAEFVTRDGTDYGEEEIAQERKVAQVLAGLKAKQYVIVFDPEMEQCNVITAEAWRGVRG